MAELIQTLGELYRGWSLALWFTSANEWPPENGRSTTRYVDVSFEFGDNSRGYKTNWRQEAQVLADKIAASLAVTTFAKKQAAELVL
ncbi:MAG: hypothetical protein FJ145_06175 [Deltaproteobacteria bacterium]|nr:hypothetical protein [Deltaproteobacteria bacterium]